jgi:DNA-binding NtrC family response regulator
MAGKHQLMSMGYAVVATSDPRVALNQFQENSDKFDAIITDQAMPHITGIDLAKNIFSIKPKIPVILCTGYSQTVTPKRVKKIGIHKLLMKPVSIADLANALDSALKKGDGPKSGHLSKLHKQPI